MPRRGSENSSNLCCSFCGKSQKEVKKLIDTHYPAAKCKAYESGKPKGEHEHDPHEDGKPPVNMRGQISGNSNAFSIVVVSCAFGKQLLRERTHLLSGMD